MKARIEVEMKNAVAKMRYYCSMVGKKEQLQLIKGNRKFLNIYEGKRCFILGNGPSLREEDLSALRDEYVFTVNQAARNTQFSTLQSNFHVWTDPHFFEIDDEKPEDLELLETMRNINTIGNKPMCFFPIEQYSFVKNHKLDQDLDVHYFEPLLEMYNPRFLDMSTVLPSFSTVTLICIAMATYMGFKEIILLGCDNTSIIVQINSFLHQNSHADYAYDISANEKQRMENLLARTSLEQYVGAYADSLKQYRLMNMYCKKKGIKLVNASHITTIDSIERKSLSEIM